MCISVCTAKTKGVLQSTGCSRVNALATTLLLSKLCQTCCEPFRKMWDMQNVSATHPGLHTLLFCLAVQPGTRRNHKICLCVSGDAQHLWSPLTLLLRSIDPETAEAENRHHPAHGSSGTSLNSWYFLQRELCFPEVLNIHCSPRVQFLSWLLLLVCEWNLPCSSHLAYGLRNKPNSSEILRSYFVKFQQFFTSGSMWMTLQLKDASFMMSFLKFFESWIATYPYKAEKTFYHLAQTGF